MANISPNQSSSSSSSGDIGVQEQPYQTPVVNYNQPEQHYGQAYPVHGASPYDAPLGIQAQYPNQNTTAVPVQGYPLAPHYQNQGGAAVMAPTINQPNYQPTYQQAPPPAYPQNPVKSPPREDSIFKRLTTFSNERMKTSYNDRKDFIKKVYFLLSLQLVWTALFAGMVVAIEPLRDGIKSTTPIVFVCMGMTFVILIAVFCYKKVAKKHPTNLILLASFTVFESYIVAFICAFYEPLIVLAAAIMTLGITAALTVYAWKTKKDFTTMGGIIVVLACSILLFGFFAIFTYNQILYTVYCLFAVIMYGIFIVYDTQLIAGGRYQELSYDDYILGALLLYIDIIGLFIYILSLFGNKNG